MNSGPLFEPPSPAEQRSSLHVGIIGSGIAGLSSAWQLRRLGMRVTLFERQPRLGMDAFSVDIDVAGETVRCDVPPRMFNQSLWPNLYQLYEEAGVKTEAVEPTKTFAAWRSGSERDQPNSKPTTASKPWLKLGSSYLPKLSPAQLLNSSTRRILRGIGQMMRVAEQDLATSAELSFREYLNRRRFSDEFVYQFLYPALSSTVCTCSYSALDAYPASVMLDAMLKLVKPEGLFRTRFGTSDVVNRLSAGIEVRLNSDVRSVKEVSTGGDHTKAEVELADGSRLVFDHAIVSTQANAATWLVDGLSESDKSDLQSFAYEDVPVVVHRDPRQMPAAIGDWSTFNILCDRRDRAMCTIWLNQFYPQWSKTDPIFQTIMPLETLPPALVIGHGRMQRPVVSAASIAAAKRLMLSQTNAKARKIWFCGSYLSVGVPLLESGVASSKRVVEQIDKLAKKRSHSARSVI